MDTKRTVNEIEEALIRREGGWRKNLCVTNVTRGSFLLDHEADLIIVNPAGYAHEFEIKRSLADFKRDFKKQYGHGAEWIYRFSYVVPLSIIQEAMCHASSIINENAPPYHPMPHFLAYDEDLYFFTYGGHPEGYSFIEDRHWCSTRKMHLEEMLRLARLGTMRYWNLRTKDK